MSAIDETDFETPAADAVPDATPEVPADNTPSDPADAE